MWTLNFNVVIEKFCFLQIVCYFNIELFFNLIIKFETFFCYDDDNQVVFIR